MEKDKEQLAHELPLPQKPAQHELPAFSCPAASPLGALPAPIHLGHQGPGPSVPLSAQADSRREAPRPLAYGVGD